MTELELWRMCLSRLFYSEYHDCVCTGKTKMQCLTVNTRTQPHWLWATFNLNEPDWAFLFSLPAYGLYKLSCDYPELAALELLYA